MKQSEDTITALKREHKNQMNLLRNENKILQNNVEHDIVQGCHKVKMELYNELLNELTTLQQSTENNLESKIMSVVINWIEELHHKLKGCPLMVNNNKQLEDDGCRNGSLCRLLAVKLKFEKNQFVMIVDNWKMNAIWILNVEYLVCEHWETSGDSSRQFKVYPQ